MIPNRFHHPYEHKLSGINYVLNRLHAYPITKRAKETEVNAIKNILKNNEYNTNQTEKPPAQPQKQNIHTDPPAPQNKIGHFYILRQRSKNYQAF
jgi:hypothetical protein